MPHPLRVFLLISPPTSREIAIERILAAEPDASVASFETHTDLLAAHDADPAAMALIDFEHVAAVHQLAPGLPLLAVTSLDPSADAVAEARRRGAIDLLTASALDGLAGMLRWSRFHRFHCAGGKNAALLEAAPDAVIEVDAEGRILLANHSCERLFGYSRSELLGSPVEMLVPDAARARHHRLRDSYTERPTIRPMGSGLTLSAQRKDGSTIPVEITLSPLWTEAGLHTAAVIRDVTERERLQSAIRASDAQARLLFEQCPVPALVYSVQTLRLLAANAEAANTYGYPVADLLTLSLGALFSDTDPGPLEAARFQAVPMQHRNRENEQIDVEIRAHDLVYGDEPARLVVVHNISERRRIEEVLEEAKTRAERANQAKSDFLASMSHELRSPLHTIIGFSELLGEELEGPLNEKQKRFVQNISKDSQHLLALINDILDLSKIEAGRMELRLEEFEINSPVEDVLSTIRPQADAKRITIHNNLDGELRLDADRVRFKQVLLNLITNAIKFTPTGGHIDLESGTANGQSAISVVDTGIGVPADLRDAIFDAFYQVSATTRGVREGTGLGLAICRRLVEGQGGRIWVEPGRTGGSRFTFTLPAAGPEGHRAERTRPLVLALEDDLASRELLREYLEPEGYEVLAANSVRDTLVKALERRPDVILLDLLLPTGSGWEALSALRNLRETQKIPIIVTSVAADESAVQRGAFAALTKPVAREYLVRTVRQALHRPL